MHGKPHIFSFSPTRFINSIIKEHSCKVLYIIAGQMRERNNLPECISYSKHLLWSADSGTGFFYKNKWYLRHCQGPGESKYSQCLKDTHLMLSGDSTTRQWYSYILENFSCQQVSEKWTQKKWKKRSRCVIPSLNFTMDWLPHTLPIVDKGMEYKAIHSIATFLDEIRNNQKAVFVIHMYAHLLYFHSSVFLNRIREISKSAKHLLDRNKLTKLLIKAPHTFVRNDGLFSGLNDYFGFTYNDILFNEFQGLHDKIVYMNEKDMTISKAIQDLHPPEEVVRASVYQLFDYICS